MNFIRERAGGTAPTLRALLFALLLACAAAPAAFAQTAQGTIQGSVTDPNGAVVVGATVEAVNNATGDRRTVNTNSEGIYTIPSLQVGAYTLSITAQGFAPTTVRNVNVTVSFTSTQDVQLGLAGAEEIVTVSTSDAQTALNTTDQQLSTLITNQKIQDLPLLSRDPNSLVLLAPGTVSSSSTLGGFIVNGQRERNNNFLVDGIDNNDADVPGIPGGISTPNIDATQEFRVITNNFNAEYGRNTGAIINVATRSGTNEFHGTGYIYYRSDRFAARNFFDTSGQANPLQRRQYGGSIGGPIRRDRTFFFVNYERDDFDQGVQLVRTVPTAAARQGIFNLSALGLGTVDIRGGNNVLGSPVNQNFVQLLNNLYPLPNSGGEGPLPGVFEFFRYSSQTNDISNQVSSRVDHRISEKHNLSGSFAFNNGTFEFCCESFPGANDAILSPQRTYRLSTNLISTFSPTFINEFRFGGNRSELIFAGEGDEGVSGARAEAVLGALSASGSPRSNQFGGTNGSFVNLTIAGISGLGSVSGGGAFFGTQFRYTGTTHFGNTATWIKGSHTMKFGGESRFVYSNGASNFTRQEAISFNAATDFGFPLLVDNNGNVIPGLAGSLGNVQNFASFLLGLVSTQSQSQYFNLNGARVGEDYRGYRVREWDIFFQDTWKVRPNLSLNYGLRYEFKGVPFEVNGQMSTLVDQDPSGPTPAGGFRFELVGKNSGGRSKLYENDWNNFAPRVGFAYSPDFKDGFIAALTGGPGRTSIRGGYGVFYDRVFGNLFSNSSANPPFQRDFFSFAGDFIENVGPVPTQTASPVVQEDEFIFPVLFALPGNNRLQKKFAMPYTQSWNFGVQRQFPGDVLVEADYVGSKGTNLLRVIDGNMTSVERVNLIRGTNTTISPTSAVTNFLNGSLNTAFFQSALNVSLAHSTYHSGQFRVTKNLSGDIGRGQIQAAYTLAHSIDNAADPLVAQSGERTFPRDSSGFAGGLGAERGNSGFDVRHRFVGNFVYELPINFQNRFLDAAFGDWTLSGIWQWQSGSPYTPFGGTDSAGTALGQIASIALPDGPAGLFTRLAPTAGLDPRTQTGPTRDLFRNTCPGGRINPNNPNGCLASADGVPGNAGRNQFYGPAYNNVDFSVIKRFPFGEDGRYRFTVRADFFNIFNQVNFGKPVNTINSSNFGQSIDAFPARRIQFVGRFEF
ncbi:MAG TPA: TonB-dependent receptor [Pyrinomonadaceae bacterium]|nr:TonB-dependent receptor [Pyrinomonadaceae bacterium]